MAIIIPVLAMPQNVHGQTVGPVVGSETAVYTFNNATQLNETSFEAKISSNSPFFVSTVLVGTNSSAVPSVSVSEWRVYNSSGGEPFVYRSQNGSLPLGNDDEVRSVAGMDVLPLGVPEGGELGVKFEVSGMEQGDRVTIMFVYMANAGSVASAEISAAAQFPAAQLPFYVTENSQPESDSTGLEISDSFVNPEIHCEICTVVDAKEPDEAAYTVNGIDLTIATTFAFWAKGESGDENVTFKVAGKGQDNEVSYANTTSVALGSEWRRYEVDLAGADLQGITHLFGFETDGGQTFYVKGAVFY